VVLELKAALARQLEEIEAREDEARALSTELEHVRWDGESATRELREQNMVRPGSVFALVGVFLVLGGIFWGGLAALGLERGREEVETGGQVVRGLGGVQVVVQAFR
jgi:hypothetical protein